MTAGSTAESKTEGLHRLLPFALDLPLIARSGDRGQSEKSTFLNGGWVRPCVRRFVTTFSSLLDRETSVVHSRPQGAGGFVGAQVSRAGRRSRPSQSADVTGQARSGDTPNESGRVMVSPSQDGSLPADVPSGSAGAEHGGSKEPSSRGLESRGGGEPPQKKNSPTSSGVEK